MQAVATPSDGTEEDASEPADVLPRAEHAVISAFGMSQPVFDGKMEAQLNTPLSSAVARLVLDRRWSLLESYCRTDASRKDLCLGGSPNPPFPSSVPDFQG